MSSNSSAEQPARRLLGAAFTAVRDEAPEHHSLLCEMLARLHVNVFVGDEAFAPRVDASGLAVGDVAGGASATVNTSLAAVLAVLEGRRPLLDAIACGELDLRGSADALDAVAHAFSTFLHGLVRAASGASLLDELRSHVLRPDPEIDHG